LVFSFQFFFPISFSFTGREVSGFHVRFVKKNIDGLLLKIDGGYPKGTGRSAGIEEGFLVTRHQ